MKRRILLAAVLAAGALVASALYASPAGAYGSAAQWQIAISFNCNNPSLCGGGGGGTWIWAEFDNDGTADATVTDCGHLTAAHGAFAGADHVNIDAHSWIIAAGSAGPATFIVTSETDTIVGHGPPVVVDIPSEYFDTGVPAVPGHYSIAQQVFGFTGPGVSAQMQVVKIPGR
jgi:hypothetical protein